MAWMIPLWYAARRRREEGYEGCADAPLGGVPLVAVCSLLVLGIAALVLLEIQLAANAIALVVAGLLVLVGLSVLLVGLLR